MDMLISDGTQLRAVDGSGQQTWATPTTGGTPWLEDVDCDEQPEVCVGLRNGNQLEVHVFDGNGRPNGVLQRAPWTNDSGVTVLASFGEYVLTTYGAGYSRKPRGAGILRYGTRAEDAYYDTGGGAHGANACGDVDGDGLPDIALGWFTPHNGGSGNGTTDGDLYGVVIEADVSSRPARFTTQFSRIITAWNPNTNPNGRLHAMMSDLDGDARDEIVYLEAHNIYYPGRNYVYIVDGGGQLRALAALGSGVEWFANAVIEDVSGDGVREIVVSELVSGGRTWVLDGSRLTVLATTTNVGSVLAVVDLDGDGLEDIVTYHSATGSLHVANAALVSTASIAVGALSSFAVGDVTGDGLRELLCLGGNLLTVVRVQ